MYHYAGNNPVKYLDPDGRETYGSDITEEQFFKISNSFRETENGCEPTLNGKTYAETQQFFKDNPKGVIYRNPDEFCYRFYTNENKDCPHEYQMLTTTGVDLLLFGRGIYRAVSSGIEKSVVTSASKSSLIKETFVEVTDHGAKRILERGFTQERIKYVITKGVAEITPGRYGSQIKYVLGKNTVVIANEGLNKGKVITAFSSEVVNGIKGYWVEPW